MNPSTKIFLPGLISDSREPQIMTLIDIIDDDAAMTHWDEIARRHDIDPDVDDFDLGEYAEYLTIEDVRKLADDPNAEVAVEVHWQDTYRQHITGATMDAVTLADRDEQALTITGNQGLDPLWVRLAYIERAGYPRAVEAAQAAYELAINTSEVHGERHANAAVAEVFLEARRQTRSRHDREQAQMWAGERMSGPTLRAVRTGMGVEQVELASRLHVSERSVRAWESGETLAPVGVSREVWDMWRDWMAGVEALIPDGDGLPIFPADTPRATLRAAAILLGGERFNVL